MVLYFQRKSIFLWQMFGEIIFQEHYQFYFSWKIQSQKHLESEYI